MSKSTTDQAEELARLSSDCSFLLTHLIRDNNNTPNDPSMILRSILGIDDSQPPVLKSRTIGWYATCPEPGPKLYQPGTCELFFSPTQMQGVCFTESTLAGLKAHRMVFNANYGLAFDRRFLFERGANPCLNIRNDILKMQITDNDYYNHLYNFIPDAIAGYINIISDSFDSTHEREWRFLGDFTFESKDIKFIFCPECEFKIFSATQINGKPCLFDLAWLDRV
jgi:hypothetical protein